MKLSFFGATRQVTGSCYLLEAGGTRILVDCGIFQERAHLGRNWQPLPAAPDSIDCLLLTHAHLDHAGLIPKLARNGFTGRIITTSASKDLAAVVLQDAAEIQEEDAAFKRKRHRREGRRGPYPEVPLYTQEDARDALALFDDVPYRRPIELGDGVTATFHDAGHILGSAMLELTVAQNGEQRTIVFSGDIGQWNKPIVEDPSVFEHADYVVMESTYGDRNHEDRGAVEDQLAGVINEAVAAGGNVVVPTFAVERAQELMYDIGRLVRAKRIPPLLAFLDSPMAVEVTEVFRRHREYMDAEAWEILDAGERLFMFPGLTPVRFKRDSKAINRIRGSCIILAGSGMCTGGRIKHHLVNNVSRPESTIMFVGYQAWGTLGRDLVEGKPAVRIHGARHDVRAKIAQIHGLSAHADQAGLLRWLGHLRAAPRRIFLTHGDREAMDRLTEEIHTRFGWSAESPEYREEHVLE